MQCSLELTALLGWTLVIIKLPVSNEQKIHIFSIFLIFVTNKCNGSDTVIFNFMLDLQSHMNDKDKQQVYNDISTSLWEC